MSRKAHDRVASRPNPEDWSLDELMTLQEAASLFWPEGPLTVTSLRTAARRNDLDVCVVAGRHLVTRRSILKMSECRRLRPPD